MGHVCHMLTHKVGSLACLPERTFLARYQRTRSYFAHRTFLEALKNHLGISKPVLMDSDSGVLWRVPRVSAKENRSKYKGQGEQQKMLGKFVGFPYQRRKPSLGCVGSEDPSRCSE